MNRVNQFVICKDNYESELDFNDALSNMIMTLLNNDYIATIRYDEKGLGIIIIEFNDADPALGGAYPYWLMAEEAETLLN